MFHKVLHKPLLKLQVLLIKRTSSKFILTHFEGIAIFDIVFAHINETSCSLSENLLIHSNFLHNFLDFAGICSHEQELW